MPRIPFSPLGETPFKKIIGHNPLVYEKWVALEKAFLGCRSLGPDLLEQVRRVIAFSQKCSY